MPQNPSYWAVVTIELTSQFDGTVDDDVARYITQKRLNEWIEELHASGPLPHGHSAEHDITWQNDHITVNPITPD
jgi:hypothetical protein